jgi:hypothetical protein
VARALNQTAAPARADERAWLLRALVVLQAPRPVFAALRSDDEEEERARSEAVLAIIILAGVAGVLWTPVARTLMNNPEIDGVLVAVWAFIGGSIYGAAIYWALGLVLWLAMRPFHVGGTFRQIRHVIAFAAAPVALSLLLLWPVRLAVYGEDVFHSGGSDYGTGELIFVLVQLAFVAWAVALLAIGLLSLRGGPARS